MSNLTKLVIGQDTLIRD